jgi:hypothetical protein
MLRGSRLYVVIVCVALFIGLGFVANPWIVGSHGLYDPVGEGLLIAVGLVGLVYTVAVCVRKLWPPTKLETDQIGDQRIPSNHPNDHAGCFALALLTISALWAAMFRERYLRPALFFDDFDYVDIGRQWSTTVEHLFVPYNEHLCVATRLFTWLICSAVTNDHLPRLMALAGMALFAATWVPLYFFVRNEFGSAVLGLVAISVFAITTVHREVIEWYSASQWCWALLALLWCLVILQTGANAPGLWRLAASVVISAIAPLNYAIGLFVGPLATVYLLTRKCNGASISAASCVAPLLGTVLFLAVAVPLKARGVIERASYAGQTPAEAVDPLKGVLFGVRSTVDLLMARNVGIETHRYLRREWYAGLFIALILVLAELVERSRRPIPLILGIAMVLIPYAVTLPLRSWVQYPQFLWWTRYQLIPQLGVTLVVCSALAEYCPNWAVGRSMTWTGAVAIISLAAIQFVVHAVL